MLQATLQVLELGLQPADASPFLERRARRADGPPDSGTQACSVADKPPTFGGAFAGLQIVFRILELA